MPVSLNARQWSNPDNQLAIAINQRAIALMGYSPSDVARYASESRDLLDRAKLYAIAASISGSTEDKLDWAADSAKYSYTSSRFTDAIGTSEFVSNTAQAVFQSDSPKFTGILKRAAEVNGWAHLRLGDIAKFNSIAEDYAKSHAAANADLKEPTPPRDHMTIDDAFGKGVMVYEPRLPRSPGPLNFPQGKFQ